MPTGTNRRKRDSRRWPWRSTALATKRKPRGTHSGQVIVAKKMPDPAAGRPFDGMWQDWLHCQILLREAESLLSRTSRRSQVGNEAKCSNQCGDS